MIFLNRDNTDGKRKDSDRSVDSLPYGKNSPPTSAKSSHNEPSSVSQINGETKTEPPTIITPNAKEDNNYLGVGSTAVSPCPSSQTPSPYTTPSSTRLQPSLSPTGLPDLSHYSEEIRALLIGAKTGEIKIPHILKDFYVYICTGHLSKKFKLFIHFIFILLSFIIIYYHLFSFIIIYFHSFSFIHLHLFYFIFIN